MVFTIVSMTWYYSYCYTNNNHTNHNDVVKRIMVCSNNISNSTSYSNTDSNNNANIDSSMILVIVILTIVTLWILVMNILLTILVVTNNMYVCITMFTIIYAYIIYAVL